MSDKTKIEWTRGDDGSPGATWNPVTGCSKVSAGCEHCYAETLAERFRGTPGHYFEHGFDVQLRPEKLEQPLRWRRPRRIFVNSMSDVFHDQVPDEYVAKVFAVMALAPQHTFQVLTKRHARMRSLLSRPEFWHLVAEQGRAHHIGDGQGWLRVGAMLGGRPLPNVWLGVSVEDQKWADIRIQALLATPAAVRFLSCEPLLGPVDLTEFLWVLDEDACGDQGCCPPDTSLVPRGSRPDWVIVGGESGRGARPMRPEWARSLRDQCRAAGVPFLFKQWGAYGPANSSDGPDCVIRLGKRKAGRVLDGRTWDEFPAGRG